MKKLSLATLAMMIMALSFGQTKTKPAVKADTVRRGYKIVIVLDTIQYKALYNFIDNLPMKASQKGPFFDLITQKAIVIPDEAPKPGPAKKP
jgi:hypothetical protein